MKTINNYINEKLVIGKNIIHKNQNTKNIDEMSPELESIWNNFEIDKLFEPSNWGNKTPFLTNEEGEELKIKLNDFLDNNHCDKTKFKYFILAGHKFRDKKIAKNFKKHNPTIIRLNSILEFSNDKQILFKKDSLRFEVSSSNKILGMYGPYGGSKIVLLE